MNSALNRERKLQALVDQERAKETREQTARAEREERERFFNHPNARADFEHLHSKTWRPVG
jgi:hypothetical protein